MKSLSTEMVYLLGRGILPLHGSISEDSYKQVYDALLFLETKHESHPLDVRICTNGGSCLWGLSIYDQLRAFAVGKRQEMTTIMEGFSRSMGVVIAQAGTRRLAYKGSSILVHSTSTRFDALDMMDKNKRQVRIDEIVRTQKRTEEILLSRAKCSLRELRDLMRRDEDISAEEALDYGFIDEIIDHDIKNKTT